MIFSRVNLSYCAADSWFVAPDNNEHIFSYKPHFFVCLHDFNMCETLGVSTYFILTFHDHHASFAQNPISL